MHCVNKKISIFSLWRDSESYIQRTLSQLEAIENKHPNIEFSYFFYENDSIDNTKKILEKWLVGRNNKFLSENLDWPKEGSVITTSRMLKMAYYRNRMINLGRFINTDYSLIFDSDVVFDELLIEKFLSKIDDETVMYTPNVKQNIKCKYCNCGQDSYYDVAPLFDSNNQQGLHWSHNPFINIFDRIKFDKKQPVEVNSAFGSLAFFKSYVLNFCNWKSHSGLLEHILFCEDVKKFGKIKVYSDIEVKVELSKELLEKYS
jgi:hypothetical protein